MPSVRLDLNVDQSEIQNAYTLALLAEAAYAEDPQSHPSFQKTVFTECTPFHNARTDTDGFVTSNDRQVVVVFRGTSEPLDWITDLNYAIIATELGTVHLGFWTALNSVWRAIEREVTRRRKNDQAVWVTGHSLGGALAALAGPKFAAPLVPYRVVTFGQPRVGVKSFATQFRAARLKLLRFVNNRDIVPTVPPRVVPVGLPPQFYEHVGELKYFDQDGQLVAESDDELGIATALHGFLGTINSREAQAERLVLSGVADHQMAKYVQRLKAAIR